MRVFLLLMGLNLLMPAAARAASVSETLALMKVPASVADDVTFVDGASLECAYDLDNGKIAVSKTGRDVSNEALARCLAPAIAQMKYEDIEAKWLAHVGVRNAWVIRNGSLEELELSKSGLTEATARDTWQVLATRELTASLSANGRAIASETHSDATVRELLGLQ